MADLDDHGANSSHPSTPLPAGTQSLPPPQPPNLAARRMGDVVVCFLALFNLALLLSVLYLDSHSSFFSPQGDVSSQNTTQSRLPYWSIWAPIVADNRNLGPSVTAAIIESVQEQKPTTTSSSALATNTTSSLQEREHTASAPSTITSMETQEAPATPLDATNSVTSTSAASHSPETTSNAKSIHTTIQHAMTLPTFIQFSFPGHRDMKSESPPAALDKVAESWLVWIGISVFLGGVIYGIADALDEGNTY